MLLLLLGAVSEEAAKSAGSIVQEDIMASDKNSAKACCSKEHHRLREHLNYCDSPSRTEEEKHHCYRFAAWQSGRRAKNCVKAS